MICREVQTGNLFANVHDRLKSFANDANHWMSSMADMSKFVVGGHSNGGLNASSIIVSRPTEIMGIVYMASYPNPGIFGFGGDDVSGYGGNVLLLVGDEDATSSPFGGGTNDEALEAYEDRFESADCKTFIELEGVGHGGFGDYVHNSHTVGTIGREPVTATIRHYLVTFMERTTKANGSADSHFMEESKRLNPVATFLTSCTQLPNNPSSVNNLNHEVAKVFPNPASDVIYIEMEQFSSNTSVKLYNLQGQLVMEKTGVSTLDVGVLSQGVYALTIDNQYVQKIVKQ
jgi:hypothetical protein